MIPTAEEFLYSKKLSKNSELEFDEICELINEYSILKSKHYVTEALKQASEEAQIETTRCILGKKNGKIINIESILNAYPLENIK